MADFGLTLTGFNLKRLADIKIELEDDFRTAFGKINVDSDSVFGQLIGIIGKALADNWEQMQNIHDGQYPSSAAGISLDNTSEIVGVERLAAISSTVVIQMLGTEATSVPASNQFSLSTTGLIFEILAKTIITKADVHIATIRVDTVVDTFSYEISVNGFSVIFLSDGSATQAEIVAGLVNSVNTNTNINTDVLASFVTGDDFITITNIDRAANKSFSVDITSANLTLTNIHTPAEITAIDSGPNSVPKASVDTIINPVAGLTSIQNLEPGVTGKVIESDVAFRIRRRNSLSIISAATIPSIQARLVQDLEAVSEAFVFENSKDFFTGDTTHLIVYDSDFVTGNNIQHFFNGNNVSTSFSVDHDTTMNNIVTDILTLIGVVSVTLTDIGGNNRTLLVITSPINQTLFRGPIMTSVVTGGVLQPVAIIELGNDGKPPHSISAIVAAPTSADQDVADKLFEIKAGGIETDGDTPIDVIDSNGDIQVMNFTHSKTKFAQVELKFDRTGADIPFPLDGIDIIRQAVLDFGVNLTFGSDLLIQEFEALGYAAGGVTNVVGRLAIADLVGGPFTLAASNISIDRADLPSIVIANVIVIDDTP